MQPLSEYYEKIILFVFISHIVFYKIIPDCSFSINSRLGIQYLDSFFFFFFFFLLLLFFIYNGKSIDL